MKQYMLYNTETETIETYQLMTSSEAEERNADLRANDEPCCWIPVLDEGDDTE